MILLVTGENKVNSYSDQLKLGWVCKFGVEFDNNFSFGINVGRPYEILAENLVLFREKTVQFEEYIPLPDLTFPDLTCPNITCSNMTCPDLTIPELTSPDLT